MAGIWDSWKSPEGEDIRSFSILTTTPNSLMEKIHDRMPVILDPETEKRWIESADADELLKFLKPCPAATLTAYPVSPRVNSTRNDAPEILMPVGKPLD